ncbi:MAG: aldehyde dehydrogenase family protein, partial [Candidatus Spechtbacterales bacterium]
CDSTSPYALTGAIHTNDVLQLCEALQALRFSAGNISDDRTTAAMVNQQPFSGLRKSGTDSKVGWSSNLRNWTKPRTICLRSVKTTFPPKYLE